MSGFKIPGPDGEDHGSQLFPSAREVRTPPGPNQQHERANQHTIGEKRKRNDGDEGEPEEMCTVCESPSAWLVQQPLR